MFIWEEWLQWSSHGEPYSSLFFFNMVNQSFAFGNLIIPQVQTSIADFCFTKMTNGSLHVRWWIYIFFGVNLRLLADTFFSPLENMNIY